jgi:hypothetical protein
VKSHVKYSLIGWLVFFVLATWAFTPLSDLYTATVKVGSFVAPQMILFFLHLTWLTCNFLEQKKKGLYYLLIILSISAYVIPFGLLDLHLQKEFSLNIHHNEVKSAHFIFLGRFMSTIPPLVISALIRKSVLLRMQKEESLELKNKMLEAETKALKAQINPHFLFNSLNNIYSLSQMESNKTSAAILNLSDILRYVTYESDKDKVGLQEELNQINSFIELALLKDENHDNIEISIQKVENGYQIAPMILLPFLENSFKHSNFEDKENGWIKIHIKIIDDKLIMTLSNSAVISPSKKDGVGGVGMENVKKRLDLIYPDNHKLHIKQDKDTHMVELEINLGK